MASFVDAAAPGVEALDELSALHPDLEPQYSQISSQLTQKLYHQLCHSIYSFVSAPIDANHFRSLEQSSPESPPNNYCVLYTKVIECVKNKVNPLTLSRVASCVANSLISSSTTEGEMAKTVLQDLLTNLQKESNDKKDGISPARLYTESKLHLLTLNLIEKQKQSMDMDMDTDISSTKQFLKDKEPILTELANSTESDVAIVHSAYYECAMTYYKAVGPPEAYYKQAIQYLHYTPLDSITQPGQVQIATDLSLSALTGEGVYNFGEVVHNNRAILDMLKGTENEWLMKLMDATANGDVTELDNISTTYASAIAAQPALVSRADVVKEKIALLALVNMVFERDSHDRTLKFEDIASRIQMPLLQVELFVMRALSLGLIKGIMDQVDGTVDINWVMPRVLDSAQMSAMASRFGEWAVKVSKTRDYMGEHIPTFE